GPFYTSFPISATPAVGFSILLLPLMDTLRVFCIRVVNGRSPFTPDRTHIHHLLLDKGLRPRTVTLLCTIISVIFTMVGFMFQGIGTTWLINGLGIFYFILIYSITFNKTNIQIRVIKADRNSNRELKEK